MQPCDTALCSLARETADYAGRAKVKAVECHGRPVRLAPHKPKSSKGFKSRLSAQRHLHAPTSTAHSPLPLPQLRLPVRLRLPTQQAFADRQSRRPPNPAN